MSRDAWRLPEGVDEVLPPAAWALEGLRRRVLDLFHCWGYQFVMPPLIEYLDSLLVGSGNDLELQTFRMVDQRSGRMLGIRADMTSQAARIDAASLRTPGTQRICYAGTVVHANPAGVLASRVPLLAGAELFGSASVEADAEVVALMVAVLECAGIGAPVLELGHVGVFRSLRLGGLEADFFEALQRKSEPDIEALIGAARLKKPVSAFLRALPRLMGGAEVLRDVRALLRGLPPATGAAIDELEQLAAVVKARCPGLNLRFDLAELSGFGYHTGAVFTAYSPDQGRPIARGGRYDGVGAAFGQARAATGFDVNLKRLPGMPVEQGAIWAPAVAGVAVSRRGTLAKAIERLRVAGERVVSALARDESPAPICDRVLVWKSGRWRAEKLPPPVAKRKGGAVRHG